MLTIYGALSVQDTDLRQIQLIGQEIVWDATQAVLGDHNDGMAETIRFFVQRRVTTYQTKYKLDGTGRLQRKGKRSQAAEVKADGEWTIQLPLEDFGASIATNRVDLAYMRLPDYARHLNTVLIQDRNTVRYEILKPILNNTARPFWDERVGQLTISPLANNDGVKYPPVIGSEQNATANHYLGVPTSAVNFNDGNSPVAAIVKKLEGRFGKVQGGSPIVIICNGDQAQNFMNLAGFVDAPSRFISYGDNISLALEELFPEGLPPGRVLGFVGGAMVVEWDWCPSGYLMAFHCGAPAPLFERGDPEETGLEPGLQLVTESPDMSSPFKKYEWSHRFGFGCGNRLNGVVVDLTAAGGANTYSIPAGYQ